MAEPFWGLEFLAISQSGGLKKRVQYLIKTQVFESMKGSLGLRWRHSDPSIMTQRVAILPESVR
ncbi:hypothetical protein N7522_008570 [Penicillium canescens]|nr:hypothetical protein N7522_008570 [Penicillium canescens]